MKRFLTNFFLKEKADNVEQSIYRNIFSREYNPADTTGRYKNSIDYLEAEEIIELNVSINTINKKQTSIINNCQLRIKEKINGRDENTTNIYYNRFLEWLNKPNNQVFPKKIEDIFSYIIRNYNKTGLTGLVFVFKNVKNISYLDTFDRIITPKRLSMENNQNQELEFTAIIKEDNKPLKFKHSPNYSNFVCEERGKIYILCPFINFIEEKGRCLSPFVEVLPFIEGQNSAIESAKNYYKNNCILGSIVNISSDDYTSSTKSATERTRALMEMEQNRIKEDFEGAQNSGKSIIAFTKNGKITIDRLSQPVISTEVEKMINMCGDKIYASVDGGNRSVFEGLNEYSNNAEIKIEESYKGTIRMAKPLICSTFDIFFKDLYKNAETIKLQDKFKNINNVYFDLDTSGVEILKAREVEEIKELYKSNLISNGSAIEGLKAIDDKWGNLKGDSELYYSEIDNKMTYDGKTKG